MTRSAVFTVLIVGACTGARYEGTAQGPALTMPAHFAEGHGGHGGDIGDAGTPDGRTLEAKPGPGSQPDPEGLHGQRFFEYEIAYEQGKLRVASVHGVRFAREVPTPRMMGRFAIELWIGRELVDRVRFDFPLVAAEDPRKKKARPLQEPPSFASGVTAVQKVLVPASTRATRALLVDRALRRTIELPWPPDAPEAVPVKPPKVVADASVEPEPAEATDGGAADAEPD